MNYVDGRTEEAMNDFCEGLFGHIEDCGKKKNKRVYIGPGRDGSSNDKVSVDCKFTPLNTESTYSKTWLEAGYVRTTFAYKNDKWSLLEHQVPMDAATYCPADDRPDRVAIMFHPPVRMAIGMQHVSEGLPAPDEPSASGVAPPRPDAPEGSAFMFLESGFDFEKTDEEQNVCFFCAREESVLPPCPKCDQALCDRCNASVGCACYLAEDEYVTLDSFVPKPGRDKATVFSKAQRKKVACGANIVKKQDEAMWQTLAGPPTRIGPMK